MLDRLFVSAVVAFVFYILCAGVLWLTTKTDHQAALIFALLFGTGHFTGSSQNAKD